MAIKEDTEKLRLMAAWMWDIYRCLVVNVIINSIIIVASLSLEII